MRKAAAPFCWLWLLLSFACNSGSSDVADVSVPGPPESQIAVAPSLTTVPVAQPDTATPQSIVIATDQPQSLTTLSATSTPTTVPATPLPVTTIAATPPANLHHLFVMIEGRPSVDLAQSVEVTADRLTLNIRLRSGLQFADGGAISSETMRLALEQNRAYLEPRGYSSSSAPDAVTLVVKSQPGQMATLMSALAALDILVQLP